MRGPTLDAERRLWRQGHRWVAGIDEVGRGAWAGPLSVGVVVLAPAGTCRTLPPLLRDSKLLPEHRREEVFGAVTRWCADGAVGHASAVECDRWGMTQALRLAARRALAALEVRPSAVIVDGPFDFVTEPAPPPPLQQPLQLGMGGLPASEGSVAPGSSTEVAVGTSLPVDEVPLPGTVVPMVGADARCAAVAAASILAKVVRDRVMREEAEHFPAYGFERNKGYPSFTHRAALRGYGLSAIHRRSWAFVDDLPWQRRADRPWQRPMRPVAT
ncbi:MAG TPA: ribonuclease HII [Acidimicrobiales bacterium]|nr:ribonuclease HII [Acidimicrobiales bacterium]